MKPILKAQRVLEISLLIISLFLMNIVVMMILQKLGFAMTMNSSSYIVPPLLAAGVLLWLAKKQKRKK